MLQKTTQSMPLQDRLSRRACWAGGEEVISLLMAKTLANPDLISLAAGFVDYETLPLEPTRQALETIWADEALARSALQYGTTIGHGPLREYLLDRMLQTDRRAGYELNLSVDQVVITAGSNQLLFLAGDTLLDPGDIVICAAPSYFVFLGILGNLGARAIGVETDQDGVIPEAVDDELARREAAGELDRVKLIYVTTYSDNPSGVTVPAQRREALVEIAKRWSRKSKIYIIEDAAYRELRYYGEDVPSLRAFDPEGDTVIHAGTFSKSFSPGIRVGWGMLPRALVEPILSQKGNLDFGSPHLNQLLMATVMKMGFLDAHVERLRQSYREKLDAILAAADEFLAGMDGIEWVRPSGGLYVWLRLPESIDTGLAGPLFDRAVREGVLYVPGEYCYPRGDRPPTTNIPTTNIPTTNIPTTNIPTTNMLRLSFGIQCCQSIRRGIEALARAIRHVLT